MQQKEQAILIDKLLHHIDRGTTDTCATPYEQPVVQYTCPDFAKKEKEVFFERRPICVGATPIIKDPGSYLTHDLTGKPLLLTRNKTGLFQAFLNVCRHRGARIVEGSGKKGIFRCPYHAWTYDIEGKLLSRPEEKCFSNRTREQSSLTPLPSLEKNGLLWVIPAPSKSKINLKQQLSSLSPELEAYNFGDFHHYKTRLLEPKINWKLSIDTFLESYHFSVLHRDSIDPIFYRNQTFDKFGENFRLVSPRKTITAIRDMSPDKLDILPHIVSIYVLFPNSIVIWQLDHLELWEIYPSSKSAEESLAQISFFTPEPVTSDKEKEHWDKNLELVLHVVENEDFPLGEGIQNGFGSQAQENITFGTSEPALSYFHETISREINRPN
ncbi:MAG: SRPBCC family protein [Pseudomonadota bacterium]|nr:SRPBCC family protein [Pseudomonadota bacterium]